jgi:hypothetical protein
MKFCKFAFIMVWGLLYPRESKMLSRADAIILGADQRNDGVWQVPNMFKFLPHHKLPASGVRPCLYLSWYLVPLQVLVFYGFTPHPIYFLFLFARSALDHTVLFINQTFHFSMMILNSHSTHFFHPAPFIWLSRTASLKGIFRQVLTNNPYNDRLVPHLTKKQNKTPLCMPLNFRRTNW